MRFLVSILVILGLELCGCSQSSVYSPEVIFNQKILKVEIADSEEERTQGLMFRESLTENEGMLFDFQKPGNYSFWMKNTKIPLSIAFLSESGQVLSIENMEPNDVTHYHSSPPSTRYALEVNQGWFKRKGVKVGDTAKFRGEAFSLRN